MRILVAEDLRVLSALPPPDAIATHEIIAAPAFLASAWLASCRTFARTPTRLFALSPTTVVTGGINFLSVDGEVYISVG